MKKLSLALLGLLATSAVAGPEMVAVTPSGAVEAVFPGASVSDANGKVSALCMAKGLTVVSSDSNSVTCQVQMSILKSAVAQALVGNSYSTTPKNLVKFNLAQVGPNVMVQANEWLETQMAFGQVRQQPIDGDDAHNDMMDFLVQSGASFVPGTAFPNHAYLGYGSGQGAKITYKGKETIGITMLSYLDVSPLPTAGAQTGDILVAINSKTFKVPKDIHHELKGIPEGQSYKVTVIRAGQPVDLTVQSVRRPTSTNAVLLTAAPKAEAASTASAPGTIPFSVADELGKLDALHKQGVLTDAEFAAQKAQLLKPKS